MDNVLPLDILNNITTYLTLPDFYHLSISCHSFNQVTKSAYVWHQQYKNALSNELQSIDHLADQSTKKQKQLVSKRKNHVTKVLKHQELVIQRMVKHTRDSHELVEGIRKTMLTHIIGMVCVKFQIQFVPMIGKGCSGDGQQALEDKWTLIVQMLRKLEAFPQHQWQHVISPVPNFPMQIYKDCLIVFVDTNIYFMNENNCYQLVEKLFRSFDFKSMSQRTEEFIMQQVNIMHKFCPITSGYLPSVFRTHNIHLIDHFLRLLDETYGITLESIQAALVCCLKYYEPSVLQLLEDRYAIHDLQPIFHNTIKLLLAHLPLSDIQRILHKYHIDVKTMGANVISGIFDSHNKSLKEKEELLNFLLDKQISKNDEGPPIICYAIFSYPNSSSINMIKRLLEYGFDPNKTDNSYTALGYVIKYIHTEEAPDLLKLLFKHGADYNLITEQYDTGLLSICEYNVPLDIAESKLDILLDNGVDINRFGREHLECVNAIRAVFIEPDRKFKEAHALLSLLIKKGADVNAIDKYDNDLVQWYTTAGIEIVYLNTTVDRNQKLLDSLGL